MAVNRYHTSARLQRWIEQRILEVFEREGFQEVLTPIVEPFEAIARGLTERMAERSIRFLDGSGVLLALRPDITTQVARLVARAFPSTRGAAKCARASGTGKLCYFGTVFRSDGTDPSGRQEITQAGAEVFGDDSPEADAGVVSVAAQCLEAAGLGCFTIVVGHVGFVDSLLGGAGVAAEDAREGFIRCLAARDIVGFRCMAREVAGSGVGLERVPDLRGGRAVVEAARQVADGVARPGSRANLRAHRALARLEGILGVLEARGFGDRVLLDLGLMRRIDYYDGMVFEGFVSGVGGPICGGGRYDRLMRRLGSDVPATGFAIEIEQAVAAVVGRTDPRGVRPPLPPCAE